jgi:uncharacterized protein (TIGR03066 family)
MKSIMGCVIAIILVAVAFADEKVEKINPQMLIGKWKGVNQGQGSMEFTKDGKYKMTDGQGKVTEMSYKVVGNEVKIDGPVRGIFDLTILKLTETELVVTDRINGGLKPQSFICDTHK